MDTPAWFASLQWIPPIPVEDARAGKSGIPTMPGVYCFTNCPGPLVHNTGVLYVGKADKSIRNRVQSYLTDPAAMLVLGRTGKISSSLKHAGKVQLLMKIQQRSRSAPSGIWLRWTERAGPGVLEDLLIKYLRPAFNSAGKPEEGMADLLR